MKSKEQKIDILRIGVIKINLLNQQLQAIKNSKSYAKKKLEDEKDPEIQEKIRKYIKELTINEEEILKELQRS